MNNNVEQRHQLIKRQNTSPCMMIGNHRRRASSLFQRLGVHQGGCGQSNGSLTETIQRSWAKTPVVDKNDKEENITAVQSPGMRSTVL